MTASLPPVSIGTSSRLSCQAFEWREGISFCKSIRQPVRIERCRTCMLYKPKIEPPHAAEESK